MYGFKQIQRQLFIFRDGNQKGTRPVSTFLHHINTFRSMFLESECLPAPIISMETTQYTSTFLHCIEK